MSVLLNGLVVVGGASAAAVLLAAHLHRLVPDQLRTDFKEHSGLISGVVGTMFAVTVGLMVVTTWGHLGSASANVNKEARALLDIYWYTQSIEPPEKTEIQGLARNYAQEVISREWPRMARTGQLNDDAWTTLDRVRIRLESMEPKGDGNKIRYGQALNRLNEIFDARRTRESDAKASVPPILWISLIASGVLVMAIPIIFGSPKLMTHGILAFGGTVVVAFVLFLIYQLNHPFIGAVRVSPDAFADALHSFHKIDMLWAHRGGPSS